MHGLHHFDLLYGADENVYIITIFGKSFVQKILINNICIGILHTKQKIFHQNEIEYEWFILQNEWLKI